MILFLENKEENTFLNVNSKIQIHGWGNGRNGYVIIGAWTIDAEDYVSLVKRSITDPKIYSNFVHQIKMGEEQRREALMKYKNGEIPADSVHNALKRK